MRQSNQTFRILHGDCRNIISLEPDGKFDLILSSPPYNIGKPYEKRTSIETYLMKQEKVIAELIRVLSPRGSLCWQVGTFVKNGEVIPLDFYYYEVFKRHGLKLRNRIVWHYRHGLHSSNRFSGRYETILWFTQSDDYIFNLDNVRIPSKYPNKRHYKGKKKGELSCHPLGKNPSDVWEIVESDWDTGLWDIPNVKAKHPEKVDHPCQFPVELVERCVLALTDKDGWVLDPYAGVGSTVIGSIKNGRNAVGIEREKKYCNIAERRIREYEMGTLKLRPVNRQVYEPKHNLQNKTENMNVQDRGVTGRDIVKEMVAGGATKTAIAKAVGVTDMTILTVSQGKTKTFRKLKKLQSVYSKWKAGKLDLGGNRGKKAVEAPVTEEATAGTKSSVKKPMVARKTVVAGKAKSVGRLLKRPAVAVQSGFKLPDVTEEMVAGVEEQIRRLQAQAKYMRDLIALRMKYGQ